MTEQEQELLRSGALLGVALEGNGLTTPASKCLYELCSALRSALAERDAAQAELARISNTPVDIYPSDTGKGAFAAAKDSTLAAETDAPQELTCRKCDAPYGRDGWCDVVIPNEIWNKVFPDGGVVCFRCMTVRLEVYGYRDVPVAIVSGPYKDANEEWRIAGWNQGHAVAEAEAAALREQVEGSTKLLGELYYLIRHVERRDGLSILTYGHDESIGRFLKALAPPQGTERKPE